ncbi:MAG: serine/threonine protein kinase [Anaerolineae bacterium]|nr:serine/threonine protein kinase [Anaerolineae bacterium]
MSEGTTGGNRFGPYIVQEKLGSGGMAVVYKALVEESGATVALKILRNSLAEHSGVVERFKQEATIAQRLRHPHIVAVNRFGAIKGRYFLELQYMPGGTLAQRFRRPTEVHSQEAVRLLRHVASALDYAHHQGIVHRDIKLENILLDRRSDAYLTDFSIARIVDGTRLTTTGSVMGTPLYISPEQARGETNLDYRGDLYSLAVIAYVLAVGHFPFNGDHALAILNQHITEPVPPPSKINPDVPKALDMVLLKGLAKRPEDRYPSADTFIEALARAMSDNLPRSTLIDVWSDHSGKEVKPLPRTPVTENANDLVEKASQTQDRFEAITYLKRALELEPLHSRANRMLFQLEGAKPSSARAAEPARPAAPIDDSGLQPLKKVKNKKKRSPWTVIALVCFLLMNATLMLVVLSALGQGGTIMGLIDQVRGTPAPVLEVDGTPAGSVPGLVLTIPPVKAEELRSEVPVSDVLDAGRTHEYSFTASPGSEVLIGIQFFSPSASAVNKNVAIIDPQGGNGKNQCYQDAIIQGDAGVAYICTINMSGEWRIRILGIQGESTGAYVVSIGKM